MTTLIGQSRHVTGRTDWSGGRLLEQVHQKAMKGMCLVQIDDDDNQPPPSSITSELMILVNVWSTPLNPRKHGCQKQETNRNNYRLSAIYHWRSTDHVKRLDLDLPYKYWDVKLNVCWLFVRDIDICWMKSASVWWDYTLLSDLDNI